INLASPLPPITTPTTFEGNSQPGFTGTPVLAMTDKSSEVFAVLEIRAASVSVRGVRPIGFAGGHVDSYRIEAETSARLVAQVHTVGVSTRLLLRDAQGQLIVQSDGQSVANGDNLIDLHVPVGSFLLEVETLSGTGTYTLTPILTPALAPNQPLPVA